MGVKNLFKFLRTNFPETVQSTPLKQLSGKTIYIDTSCLFYQYMSFATYYAKKEDSVKSQVNLEGHRTSHLIGIASLIKNFSIYGIEPVFIFDGQPLEIKAGEVSSLDQKTPAKETILSGKIRAEHQRGKLCKHC